MTNPITIYFTGEEPLYGYNYNSEALYFTKKSNNFKNKALFIDFNDEGSTVFRENEIDLKKYLTKNKVQLYIPSLEILIDQNLKNKISYYYPEFKKYISEISTIDLHELNSHILSGLQLEKFEIKNSGILIPIENYSYYRSGAPLYTYVFIDFSKSTYSNVKDSLKKLIPLINTSFSKEIELNNGRIGKFINRFMHRKTRERIEFKKKITSVRFDIEGFEKKFTDRDYFINKKDDNNGIFFSLKRNQKTKEEELEQKNEYEFTKMLQKASSIKNDIKELADNGFEELALMAIIKGLNITQEINIKELNQKIFDLQNSIPQNVEKKWFAETNHHISRLTITPDYKIILTDYDQLEIKLNPLHKSLFLLFLSHPEGIYLNKMENYKEKLMDWYLKLSDRKLSDKFEKSIADICNPFENSLYEKLSRIKKEFITQMDDRLAKWYYISGNGTDAKKINLPQELIIWEK